MYILASLYQLAQCPASKMMMILWWKGSSCADSDGCPIYGQPRPFLEHFSSSSSSFSHCNSHHHDHHHHNQQMLMCWSKKNPKKTRFLLTTGVNILRLAVSIAFVESSYCDTARPKRRNVQMMSNCPNGQMVLWLTLQPPSLKSAVWASLNQSHCTVSVLFAPALTAVHCCTVTALFAANCTKAQVSVIYCFLHSVQLLCSAIV